MKLNGPETSAAAANQPPTVWGKLLASTPVVMTVLATLLAGLSSSEMTRAQYDRSLAAQQQSKIADQWSFFQAKRLRGASLRANLQLLQATCDLGALDGEALRRLGGGGMPATNLTTTLDVLSRGQLPPFEPRSVMEPRIRASVEAVAAGQTDAEVMALLRSVSPADLTAALRAAQADSRAFEVLLSPIGVAIEQLGEGLLTQVAAAPDALRPLWRNFTAAQMRYDAARYDAEARHNRTVAELYELQVRLSNSSAERHHLRSQRFFFGMLGAQAAVILASLALAAQQRNVLWGFAAAIGLAALGFAIYVYWWI